MTRIVLIHGAWHGGWCWGKVAPPLRAAGHDVYTPTLTGLGERSHLLSPEVGLDTHVQDIVATLEVVMGGHSYGGMVMTAVADRAADRLAHLIDLDAFVPANGQALADLADPTFYARLEAGARSEGEGWRVPPPPLERWGIRDEADVGWMRPRIGAHPLKTSSSPCCSGMWRRHCFPARSSTVRKSPRGTRLRPRAGIAGGSSWRYRELASGHDAMVTAPNDVAALIVEPIEPRLATKPLANSFVDGALQLQPETQLSKISLLGAMSSRAMNDQSQPTARPWFDRVRPLLEMSL